jgi:hypothetical protein
MVRKRSDAGDSALCISFSVITCLAAMIPADVFRQITELFDKTSIPYMLTGSWASNYHGAPRSTADIDFVIAASAAQVRAFLNLLPASEYYFDLPTAIEAAQKRSMFNIISDATGWKIDLIFHKAGAFDEEKLRRRTKVELDGAPVFVATAEDVLVSKLEWAKMGESSRQIEDAAGILKVRGESLDRAYIEKWVRELALTPQWDRARKLAGLE